MLFLIFNDYFQRESFQLGKLGFQTIAAVFRLRSAFFPVSVSVKQLELSDGGTLPSERNMIERIVQKV